MIAFKFWVKICVKSIFRKYFFIYFNFWNEKKIKYRKSITLIRLIDVVFFFKNFSSSREISTTSKCHEQWFFKWQNHVDLSVIFFITFSTNTRTRFDAMWNVNTKLNFKQKYIFRIATLEITNWIFFENSFFFYQNNSTNYINEKHLWITIIEHYRLRNIVK